jgi:hypothetical protein
MLLCFSMVLAQPGQDRLRFVMEAEMTTARIRIAGLRCGGSDIAMPPVQWR